MEGRDLDDVVTQIMQQRFDWWDHQQTLSLLLDFAVNGVATRLEEVDDESEHGIYVSFNHGRDCEGCLAIQELAFAAIRRGRDATTEA